MPVKARATFYRRWGKRAFDLVLTLPALLLLAPALLVLALLVRWKLGTPVFFRHQRPGRNGQLFTLIKFRTMTDARDAAGKPLPDAQRLTTLGRVLRATSLDELPELLNVLKGDMSLVGPRPLLIKYLPWYTETERTRFDVLPGITGWAQVNGRNELAWDKRLAADVWYVTHCSFWLDLKVLGITLVKVLRRDHVHADPESAETYLDEERRASVVNPVDPDHVPHVR